MTDRHLRIAIGFGSRLRNARKALGLSQRRLALMLGVTPSYLCHIEKGERLPTVLKIYEIADRVGVSPKKLLP